MKSCSQFQKYMSTATAPFIVTDLPLEQFSLLLVSNSEGFTYMCKLVSPFLGLVEET